MKRILLLGGSTQQIPAIQYAKQKGYGTILCDYLQDNPGQHYADKFYCVSTTDQEAVLNVAKIEKVDGVVAYASDPAATTAAYVAEMMGLPTNPYQSVKILARKDLLRNFLEKNGFNSPLAESFTVLGQAKAAIEKFTFPVMVKPVDSSGSKGVKRIETPRELEAAFNAALSISKSKNVIIEEFIIQDHPYMIGGDCFVINGKVEFWGLLNSHRNVRVSPFVPIGTSYPVLISSERIEVVKMTVQKLVDLLGIRFGAFNLELMFDKHGKAYIIEMGPRNGGNMIPDLLQMITGIDLVGLTIESALGCQNLLARYKPQDVFYATFVLHTKENGLFKEVRFSDEIEGRIIKKVIYKKPGDPVRFFDGADKAVGIIFLKFSSMKEMIEVMESSESWLDIVVV